MLWIHFFIFKAQEGFKNTPGMWKQLITAPLRHGDAVISPGRGAEPPFHKRGGGQRRHRRTLERRRRRRGVTDVIAPEGVFI